MFLNKVLPNNLLNRRILGLKCLGKLHVICVGYSSKGLHCRNNLDHFPIKRLEQVYRTVFIDFNTF
jgi:hypothetical protein